jgi:hypothetical protein
MLYGCFSTSFRNLRGNSWVILANFKALGNGYVVRVLSIVVITINL